APGCGGRPVARPAQVLGPWPHPGPAQPEGRDQPGGPGGSHLPVPGGGFGGGVKGERPGVGFRPRYGAVERGSRGPSRDPLLVSKTLAPRAPTGPSAPVGPT